MGCPPAMVLERFSEGRLNPKTYQHVVTHLQECPSCAATVTPVNPPTDPGGAGEDNAPTQVVASAGSPAPADASPTGPQNVGSPARKAGEPLKWAAIPLEDPTGTGAQWAETDQSFEARRLGAATEQLVMPRGTPLGRYILLEPLGSGGLGVVYAAYDPELDRRVAIKLLRPGVHNMGDGANTERLLREGQAMARLSHPNVVTVHDVGRLGEEVFIAMELVDGPPLSRWIKQGPHPWRTVRDVMVQAGKGLAAAHAVGLVHRDFKPGNVLVTFDDQQGPSGVRVLDFGLARAISAKGPAPVPVNVSSSGSSFDISGSGERPLLNEELTQHGTIMGTPQFMAPEQFRRGEVSEAADQFAYCVTFWLALYGSRPFDSENILQLPSLAESGAFTEPTVRHGVPQWLHRALRRGLSGDPNARFPTIDALLDALQRDKRSRRRQWFVLASAIVLSAGGAATVATLMSPSVTVEQRSQVDELSEQAREAASKSFFVYPPPDEPEHPTAYRRVLQLEELEGGVEATARQRAVELRSEFADTLVRLGDQYFERPGGKAFAADYYAAALIFEADNERARERTTLTPGEVATLRDKASDAGFSQAELVAAESLAVLAEDDETVRIERLAAMYERSESPSPSTSARLESLLSDKENDTIALVVRGNAKSKKRRAGSKPKIAIPKLEGPANDEPVEAVEPPPGEAPAPAAPTPPARDRGKSAEVAKAANKALRSARLDEAEKLFHKSLSYDKRNAKALAGLAEVAFERGSYQKAVQFGRKAVSQSPRSGRYRIILGDAYFKTLSYQSAKREYAKAKELGHPKASARLKQLEDRVGG